MLPALDNYVSYGSDMLKQNPALLEAIFDIIQTVLPGRIIAIFERK